MKRKLDANDVPVPTEGSDAIKENVTFASLGLDARLLQGIAKQNFQSPTLVQSKAIPLTLEGRDILARAKTGSGKTAAYLLPILHSILKRKELSSTQCTTALILVPTRELADQVYKTVESFTAFCAKDVRAVNLTQRVSDAVQRSLLADSPDIVIATPARASLNANTSALSLANLTHMVIDEADLVLSYGYDEDLQNVAKIMPKGVQTVLMSATLTSEVETLKGLFCRNPEVLKLEEAEDEGEGVSQFVVKCAEDEKFLLTYVIFKLKLIKGKCIIFVGDIDRCYRLKLFLEQFGTRSCILNSQLPVNSRIHVVEEFNKNVYDIIIASDEHEVLGDEDEPKSGDAEEVEADDADEEKEDAKDAKKETKQPSKKKQKTGKKDKEYGVSRGIDFKNVACVLNFDLPTSSKSYTHRIGRTARAGQTGMALSFVIPSEQYRKHKPTSIESAKNDEKVLAKIVKHQAKKGKEVKPYNFDMKQVDAFRYRMGDALRAVTSIAVQEAKTREIRQELMKSDKLKRHFEENPGDLYHLRHDGELRPARVQAHLKHVPDYLLPKEGKKGITGGDVGFVGMHKTTENRIRKARAANKAKGRGKGRKSDPLKTFKAKSKK
ncbi:Bcdbp9 [Botrytis cinerea B05.10]|uniref:ATP-dependent RNA helicase dbp9 n=2 Tax=Botryotinia fuckeliana TaxID=40559 RepID=DBP9_BOTFB|nr:Bcdbp9 [Botrytis cinerea B05.10]A6SNX1.2 RecName: Full=ATP-dependent RNA helicase dbp9 [Botrytis cinerea B05.10]ATZ51830.1 Bcdbp9 [Botrytis cinerea B05.10]EMR83342.1 putative atp-dependent rna helicase dbp9 protein [Botrytis cinerea BcDW1]